MKNQYSYFLVFCFLFTLFSNCKSTEEDTVLVIPEYEIKRNNILGDWSSKQTIQEFRGDTLYDEYLSSFMFDYSFEEAGTGSRRMLNLGDDFNWIYQHEPALVILNFPNFNYSLICEIIKNESDQQIWKFETNQTDSLGMTTILKHTLKLDK